MSVWRLPCLALAFVVPLASGAQEPVLGPDSLRYSWGAGFTYGIPVGDFRNYVNDGVGIDFFGRWPGKMRGVTLRLEGGLMQYGNQTSHLSLGLVDADLQTNNVIAWFGAGPQLTLRLGLLRPYFHVTAGLAQFATESWLKGASGDANAARTTNYSSTTFAWGAGVGILRSFRTATGEMSIDLGARFHNNGKVSYLREGAIENLPDGGIVFHATKSATNLVTVHVGAAISRY